MPNNIFFADLPATSRVWVYQSNRAFTNEEAAAIETAIKTFVSGWTAHKLKVAAGALLLYNRFVVLAADEREVGVSGCSIDSSVRFIKELGAQYQVDFFDRFNVAYKVGTEVRSASRTAFEGLVAQGAILPETIVYNNLVEHLTDFRNSWEVPFAQSWHSRIFQLA